MTSGTSTRAAVVRSVHRLDGWVDGDATRKGQCVHEAGSVGYLHGCDEWLDSRSGFVAENGSDSHSSGSIARSGRSRHHNRHPSWNRGGHERVIRGSMTADHRPTGGGAKRRTKDDIAQKVHVVMQP